MYCACTIDTYVVKVRGPSRKLYKCRGSIDISKNTVQVLKRRVLGTWNHVYNINGFWRLEKLCPYCFKLAPKRRQTGTLKVLRLLRRNGACSTALLVSLFDNYLNLPPNLISILYQVRLGGYVAFWAYWLSENPTNDALCQSTYIGSRRL